MSAEQFRGLEASRPVARVAVRPVQASAWSGFLPLALAVYLGVTAAGLTIAAGVRLYLHWSVKEWKKEAEQERPSWGDGRK